MPVTTYCEDADITARCAQAYSLNGDSADYSKQRQIAYDQIGIRLLRRNPCISQAGLGVIEELKEAEILYTLYQLYRDAASRADPNDIIWANAQAYKRDFEIEIVSVPLPAGAVPSMGSCPIRRS